MKLFLIHAGFYDPDIMDGLYEQHVNYFVAADDVKGAKKAARENPDYRRKKMHIDGIQELNAVDGYRIKLVKENSISPTINYGYDEIKKLKV